MTDFEVMPVGTRRAVEDTAKLLRSYEQSHRERITAPDRGDILDVRDKANADRAEKAERNRIAAERLEALLLQQGVSAR